MWAKWDTGLALLLLPPFEVGQELQVGSLSDLRLHYIL